VGKASRVLVYLLSAVKEFVLTATRVCKKLIHLTLTPSGVVASPVLILETDQYHEMVVDWESSRAEEGRD